MSKWIVKTCWNYGESQVDKGFKECDTYEEAAEVSIQVNKDNVNDITYCGSTITQSPEQPVVDEEL